MVWDVALCLFHGSRAHWTGLSTLPGDAGPGLRGHLFLYPGAQVRQQLPLLLLRVLLRPCRLLSASTVPVTNSPHNILSVVRSQSSFPCSGSHWSLTKTAGSEDSEKLAKHRLEQPWAADSSPTWGPKKPRQVEMGEWEGLKFGGHFQRPFIWQHRYLAGIL